MENEFVEPYFVTPHAVERFQKRVKNIPASEVIEVIQRVLQGKQPVCDYLYDKQVTKLYLAAYNNKAFYLPVTNGNGEWPAVVSVLPLKLGITPRGRKLNPIPRHCGKWTKDEKLITKLLREQGYSHAEVGKIIERTKKSVEGKCYRARIICRPVKTWTPQEERMVWLLTIKFGLSRKEVADLLGRTKDSVCLKLCRMQKKLRDENSENKKSPAGGPFQLT